MSSNPLTKRQAEVLAFLRAFHAEHGRMPRIREMGDALGIGSTNGVTCAIQILVRKGFLERLPAGTRSGEYRLVVEPGHCRSCGQALPEGPG